jgi:beta-glucosidase
VRETVFLFAHDALASVARPVLELKGWQQIELQAGEQATVALQLAIQHLQFLGGELNRVYEPGDVEILVGFSADRSRLLGRTIRLI